jgi:hypothetical protein
MNQALYAHMNNKRKMKKKIEVFESHSSGRPRGCYDLTQNLSSFISSVCWLMEPVTENLYIL